MIHGIRRRGCRGVLTAPYWDTLVVLVVGLLVSGAGSASAASKGERSDAYRTGVGPYTVIIAETSLHDAARGKDVYMRIFIPQVSARSPVIIYSHGAGASKDTPSGLFQYWCSYGYVCIVPSHAQADEPKGAFRFTRLAREFEGIGKRGAAYFADRVADLRLIMDHLDSLERAVPELQGRMNTTRIGLSGHSLGSCTVLAMGGATLYGPNGKTITFEDNRPRAILALSCPPRDAMIHESSFATVTRPLMVIRGSLDPGPILRLVLGYKRLRFSMLPPGDKYLLNIRGANHLSYLGPLVRSDKLVPVPAKVSRSRVEREIKENAPALGQMAIFHYVQCASLAFWDAYLKGNAAAKAYLNSTALAKYSLGAARLVVR